MQVDAHNPIIGDIYIGATGTDELCPSVSSEVQQSLYTRFRMFQGEWFLNALIGLPWFQQILGKKQSLDIVGAIFQEVITTCPEVASLDNFAIAQTAQRVFSLKFSCTTVDGATVTEATFANPYIVTVP